MSQNLSSEVAVIGIDIGKNSFHVVSLDARGAIQLRQKWSAWPRRRRLANYPNFSVADSVSRRRA
jgi:transposase